MDKFKCTSCEETYNEDDWQSLDKDGNQICQHCYHSMWQDATKILTWSPEDQESKEFYYVPGLGSTFNQYHEEIWGEEDHLHVSIDGVEWKSTSAWRGHYEIDLSNGWKEIESGWGTGYWSDVPWKHGLNDLVEKVMTGYVGMSRPLIGNFKSNEQRIFIIGNHSNTEKRGRAIRSVLETEYGMLRDELKRSLT